jgi:hypothetical protein
MQQKSEYNFWRSRNVLICNSGDASPCSAYKKDTPVFAGAFTLLDLHQDAAPIAADFPTIHSL